VVQPAPAAGLSLAAAKDSSDSHKDTSSFNYVPRVRWCGVCSCDVQLWRIRL
jgi:hypothetical protein